MCKGTVWSLTLGWMIASKINRPSLPQPDCGGTRDPLDVALLVNGLAFSSAHRSIPKSTGLLHSMQGNFGKRRLPINASF